MNLMSKEVQAEYAIKSGLNVPESIIVRKGEKTNWNNFPCIIKPLKSIIGAGKADIHVVKDSEELNQVLDTIQADTIQIQKYIAVIYVKVCPIFSCRCFIVSSLPFLYLIHF